jgi:predicted RecA/RadA family phage recombinase
MRNYVAEGRTLEFTAAAALTAGQAINVGDVIVVAIDNVAAGARGVGVTEGVFSLPKVPANVITLGERLFLASGQITDNSAAAGAVYAGRAYSEAGNGATSVDVKINV